MPVISALRKVRQEDRELTNGLGYKVRDILLMQTIKKKQDRTDVWPVFRLPPQRGV